MPPKRKPPAFKIVHLTEPCAPAFAEHDRAVAEMHASEPERVAVVERHLGLHGRMISASKSRYYRRYPTRLVMFNANVLVDGAKMWWGDLDVTEDEPKLRRLAGDLGCEVHVLSERDARFANEAEPLLEYYVYWTDGLESRLGPSFEGYYERRHGRIRRRRRRDAKQGEGH